MNQPNFRVLVQKYGGSSVASAHKIKHVARFIKSAVVNEQRICVVVSAMGHTTNDLLALAKEVCADPPKRELDMLLSCGERASMALLAMALKEIDVDAISLTGSQSGIITDEHHSSAEIIAVKPNRVKEAFLTHHVVIIAGFQGVSEKREITTLRRGGSDTTAVAMAYALGADVCEIYTDVSGVMDIDPKVSACAQVLPLISFDQMESMALYGAKVLAHDAIRLAKEWNVALRVAQTGDALSGTRIEKHVLSGDSDAFKFAFSNLRAVVRFSLDSGAYTQLSNRSGYFLCGAFKEGKFVGYMSNDIAQELMDIPNSDPKARLALITVHLARNQIALKALAYIDHIKKSRGFLVEDLLLGKNEIFLVVHDDDLNDFLSALHTGLSHGGLS